MAESGTHILTLASQIVTAHVSHNVVGTGTVPDLIRSVYNALAGLDGSEPRPAHRPVHAHHGDEEVQGHRQTHGAIYQEHGSPRRGGGHKHSVHGQTVFDDHLVCMEDGLSMKMLKRHLQTVHGLTPHEYRTKWGLPPDYPMVAANYARLRSSLALESGLGLKPEARAGRGRRGTR